MEIVHRLQQSTCTSNVISTCLGSGTGKDKCSIIGTGTVTNAGAHDMDYHLTVDIFVRFRYKIYVPDNSELNKVTLREFHAKPYSGHPGY